MQDEIINVAMDESLVTRDFRTITTQGLGPCVGVVLGYKDWGAVLHAAMGDESAIQDFVHELTKMVPIGDRGKVAVLLCGGSNIDYCPEDRSDMPETTPEDDVKSFRHFVADVLKRAGFKTLNLKWGKLGEHVDVELDVVAKIVHLSYFRDDDDISAVHQESVQLS